MSTHNYTRTQVADGFDLGGRDFGDTVRAALPGNAIRIKCAGTTCEIEATPDLVAGEVTTLDAAVAGFKPIKRLRKRRFAEIEAKTIRLLSNKGFEYPASSGTFFPLTQQAQLEVLGLKSAVGTAALSLPYNVSTTTNQSIALPDNAAVNQFHRRAMTRLFAVLEGETDLKAQIRAATTEADILAVVDNRS